MYINILLAVEWIYLKIEMVWNLIFITFCIFKLIVICDSWLRNKGVLCYTIITNGYIDLLCTRWWSSSRSFNQTSTFYSKFNATLTSCSKSGDCSFYQTLTTVGHFFFVCFFFSILLRPRGVLCTLSRALCKVSKTTSGAS